MNVNKLQYRWGDFKIADEVEMVVSEIEPCSVDRISDIAKSENWKDHKFFCYRSMIATATKSGRWVFKPADVYSQNSTIPAEGVERLYLLLNEGVKIKGVIVGDDTSPIKRLKINLDPIKKTGEWMLQKGVAAVSAGIVVLAGLAVVAGVFLIGKFLLPIIAGLVWKIVPLIMGAVLLMASPFLLAYDPSLIVVVEDKGGRDVWIQVYQWFE